MKCYPPKAEWHGEFPADGTVCLTLHQFAPFFFMLFPLVCFACRPVSGPFLVLHMFMYAQDEYQSRNR